jgi:hypothetical protein
LIIWAALALFLSLFKFNLCITFPGVDFEHFVMRFIAHDQFLCICYLSFSCFLDVEKSIKMMQIFLKPNQTFVFVSQKVPAQKYVAWE